MFLTSWLVTKVITAAVTGVVDYPLAADFFMAESSGTLFFYGGSKDYASNVDIYNDGYSYPIESAYNITTSEPGTYKASADICGVTYMTTDVTVSVPVVPSSSIVAFHYAGFVATDYNSAYSTKEAAAEAGFVYADTPGGTYTWGTLAVVSNTATNTEYTWTPPSTITADVLLVAGGGGGSHSAHGNAAGGAGGAGGLVYKTGETISGPKTIVVGNGGVEGNGGINGQNTTAIGLTALGGGGGAQDGNVGKNGGSGGGGDGATSKAGGNGLQPSQPSGGFGNNGGTGGGTSTGGGGGGGAGTVGQNGNNSTGNGGNGGDGKMYSISGNDVYYAGGGGGGTGGGGTIGGIGGLGGGGNGGWNAYAQSGSKHTGGGGGGSNVSGGSGGSGIVLISSYPVNQLTHDGFDKLTVANTSNANTETNLRLGSNVWYVGSLSDVYISKPGAYKSFTVDPDGQVAHFGNVTVSAVTQNVTTVASTEPTFTSDSTVSTGESGWVVSASSIYNSTFPAWKAFNDGTGLWHSAEPDTGPHWLKIKLPSTRLITSYELKARDDNAGSIRAPETWVLQGSNNDSSWVDLETTHLNDSSWTGGSNPPSRVFNITTSIEYQYYRVYITDATNDNAAVAIGEFTLNFIESQPALPPNILTTGTLAFHHGTFVSGEYGYTDVATASAAGFVYANTQRGTYAWGELTANTLTTSNTAYTCTPVTDITGTDIEYLVVAGGGGGGFGYAAGGGGAGGFVDGSMTMSTGTFSIVVGTGGSGGITTDTIKGESGKNSSFNDVIALGGGGAGSRSNPNGLSGGSGGGGSRQSGSAGLATQPSSSSGGYGNNGGTGDLGGAGGGGAGGVGTFGGTQTTASIGGPGKISTISGNSLYYAAGGGSGSTDVIVFAEPASGIGGRGGNTAGVSPTPGQVHTGSGGGGSGDATPGAAGGSGIVLINNVPFTGSPASLSYDGYNKLSVNGIDDQTLYEGSNSYALGTASNVYIADPGEYTYFTNTPTYAFLSNVTVGAVSVDIGPTLENPEFTSGTTVASDYSSTYGWDTNSGWEVTASSGREFYPVSKLFNKVTAIDGTNRWISTDTDNAWARIKYPYPVKLVSYIIANAYDRGWDTGELQGSDDAVSWVKLSDLPSLPGTNEYSSEISVTSSKSYLYFRILLSGTKPNAVDSDQAAGEWKLYTVKDLAPPTTLTYNNLHALVVTGAEASSYITYNTGDGKKLACGTDLSTYQLHGYGNYKAYVAGPTIFTLTNTVTIPSTEIFPIYQYPPLGGTVSSLTTSIDADAVPVWTISGADYANGEYKSKASIATTGSSATSYHAFDTIVTASTGFVSVSSSGTLGVYLPSAVVIRKYVVWPYDADTTRPSSWTLEGSNEDSGQSGWTTLHAVTATPPSLAGDVESLTTFGSYRWYRINVTANAGGSGIKVAELVLWGDIALDTTPTFSDSWSGGTTYVTIGSAFTLPTITNISGLIITGSVDSATAGTYDVSWSKVGLDEIVKRVIRRFIVPYFTVEFSALTFDGFDKLSVVATNNTTNESFGYTVERSSISASGPWTTVVSGVDVGATADVTITEAGFYRTIVHGIAGVAPVTTTLANEIAYTPARPEDTVIKNKVSGDRHTLVVLEDGTVYAWGRGGNGIPNNPGGLGDGLSTSSSTPIQVVGVGGNGFLTGVDSVYTNTNSSYAIKDGNVYAWGRGGEGDLGIGVKTVSQTPVQVLGVGGTGYLSNIVKLAGGTYRINAISSTGDVYGWGRDVYGSGLSGNQTLPVQVRGVGGSGFLTNIVDIKAYYEFGNMAVKSDGTVYSWGYNNTGWHGTATSVNATATYPVQVLGVGGVGFMTDVVAVGGGGSSYTFSVLLKNDGTVYACGNNANGQLGDGTITNRTRFVQVSGLTDIVKITGSALCTSTLALKSDGTVYSWGLNSNGQLGDNTIINRSTPVQVLGLDGAGFLTDVIDIDVGDDHSIALTKDGSVYTWGGNAYGQLGNGTATNVNCLTPKKVLKGVWPGDGSYLLHGYNVEIQPSLVTNATLTFDGINKLTVAATNNTTVESFGYTVERSSVSASGPWTTVASGVNVGATIDVTITEPSFYRAIVQGTAGGIPVTTLVFDYTS